MLIAVGSTNPIKRAAAEKVLFPIFRGARFINVAVTSGVPDQPMSDDETRHGAYNRAQAALADADMGIGLEGGILETDMGMFTCAWCVIIHQDGTTGIGGGSHLQLPDPVAQAVRAGTELGTAMDELTGLTNVKHHAGAIGILTDGLLSRQDAYEVTVRLAAAPFRTPNYYRGI
jgi:inosine/xanthosine triphosphatase